MLLRWGIIGAGGVCHDFVTALNSLPSSEHKVVAIATKSDLTKAENFASSHSIPQAYGSYKELSLDENVDIVYVGTLIIYHHNVSVMMLEAGKHVLCEKPLSMNPQETKEMIETAKKNNRFFMEGIWCRFLPAYGQLSTELARKTVGDIMQVEANLSFKATLPRLLEKDLGGGTVYDVLVYALQLTTFVYGLEKPEKIVAVGKVNDDGIDEVSCVTLLYKGGQIARITCSFLSSTSMSANIFGTEGKLEFPEYLVAPLTLITPSGFHKFPLPETTETFNFTNSLGFIYEIRHVRKCIEEGLLESPSLKHEEMIFLSELTAECKRQIYSS